MGKGYTELSPFIASAAFKQGYARELKNMVKAMHKSVLYWVLAAYRQAPTWANDAAFVPSTQGGKKQLAALQKKKVTSLQAQHIKVAPAQLHNKIDELFKRWEKKWDEFGQQVAQKYVNSINNQTKITLEKALKDAGFTVNLKLSPQQKAVMQASVYEQVALIKKIPQQYHWQVEALVQKYFQDNKNVRELTKELKKNYTITARRAYLIAQDQTAKMTNTLSRSQCINTGLTEGIWMHRAGGSKTFRATHVAMNGKKFNLSEGMYDPHEKRKVQPSELPFCKCTYKPVLPFEINKGG